MHQHNHSATRTKPNNIDSIVSGKQCCQISRFAEAGNMWFKLSPSLGKGPTDAL